MKHFAFFVAGVIVATITQIAVAPAHAAWSLQENIKNDRSMYEKYLECRDRSPKVVTYECLRLNPLGFRQL
jgi:hypothetical protein